MFGVVLWSDQVESKAVIWCEDHGDLAFYHHPTGESQVALDAGDWVQFDLTLERHLRFAHNPRLISEGVYPEIADTLAGAGAEPAPAQSFRGSAEVIPLATARLQRDAAAPQKALCRA